MTRFAFSVPLAAFLIFAGVAGAHASVVYTFTASGQPVSGTTDSAEAIVTVGTGTLSVTLEELSPYTGLSDVSLLSGISFILSGTVSAPTLASHSYGGLANLASNGTVTTATEASTHWGVALASGTMYLATVGTGSASGKPADLIIGPNTNGNFNSYSSVGSSVTGHLPVVLGEASFVIDVPGVTSSTTLSNVMFNFGTTSGQTLTGVAVPEPASSLMLASGLLGMGLFARKKAATKSIGRRAGKMQ
jgi:hypothetical protein